MTDEDYEQIRLERPELKLPEVWTLNSNFRASLSGVTAGQLIAGRTYVLLSRPWPYSPRVDEHGVKIV